MIANRIKLIAMVDKDTLVDAVRGQSSDKTSIQYE